MTSDVFSPVFHEALGDYLFLLEKGYPARGSLSLVADRYRLSATQRIVLFRGVDTRGASAARAALRTESCAGLPLTVDLFNVLFTVSDYLYGRVLFISTDGFLRDNGEEYGRHVPGPVPEKAAGLLFRWLSERKPSSAVLAADERYDGAAALLETVSRAVISDTVPVWILCLPGADRYLRGMDAGVIATADSEIIPVSGLPVMDAAADILTRYFSPGFPDLRDDLEKFIRR